MTDYRHCDGPSCPERRPVETFEKLSGDSWLTLEGTGAFSYSGREKHFHSETCLLEWTREKIRKVGIQSGKN